MEKCSKWLPRYLSAFWLHIDLFFGGVHAQALGNISFWIGQHTYLITFQLYSPENFLSWTSCAPDAILEWYLNNGRQDIEQ